MVYIENYNKNSFQRWIMSKLETYTICWNRGSNKLAMHRLRKEIVTKDMSELRNEDLLVKHTIGERGSGAIVVFLQWVCDLWTQNAKIWEILDALIDGWLAILCGYKQKDYSMNFREWIADKFQVHMYYSIDLIYRTFRENRKVQQWQYHLLIFIYFLNEILINKIN